ncbi:MAG: hypothetical protein ACYC35_19975 [Pirellulales bacterium]
MTHALKTRRSGSCLAARRRRGMAIVIILGLISIALALSYAVMRSQSVAFQIQGNSQREAMARQAALTGLSVALGKMHRTAEWAGADSSFAGSTSTTESFQVAYQTGDPSLTPTHPDYADWPYRVTISVTGSSADPANPAATSSHQVRAVVRLAPRAVAAEPADWSAMTQHTVYQYREDAVSVFSVDVPSRIEGPIRTQGRLDLGKGYAWDDLTRARYMEDLNAMRSAGYADMRPFTGRIDFPYAKQEAKTLAMLGDLAVATSDVPRQDATNWNHPGTLSTYRIYPGGKEYTVPTYDAILQNTTLQPDPMTNPLGIFFRATAASLRNNVTVQGTLVTNEDIDIEGTNVRLQPVSLPALDGSDAPVQLPILAAARHLRIWEFAGGTATGLMTIWDTFEIKPGPAGAAFAVQGGIVARKILIGRRWLPWDVDGVQWKSRYLAFMGQLGMFHPINYFPVWLSFWDLSSTPLLTIKPASSPVTYHWKNPGDTVYVPRPSDGINPSDEGLHWDLLEWTDNP